MVGFFLVGCKRTALISRQETHRAKRFSANKSTCRPEMIAERFPRCCARLQPASVAHNLYGAHDTLLYLGFSNRPDSAGSKRLPTAEFENPSSMKSNAWPNPLFWAMR